MPSPQWTVMGKLVQQIYSKSDAEPFRDPVDWKGLGLYDYPQIVKKPMDLGQIKRKIEKEEYASVHDAAEDVRLVWNNCKTYNADGSDFYLLAESMSSKFEERFAKLLKELNIAPRSDAAGGGSGSKGSTISPPTLDEKKSFAKLLYKLTKEDLGKVIIELDQICPQSITKNSAEDQVEVNVDNIEPEAFQKVMQYVKSCTDGIGSGSSRKKKTASSSSTKAKKARTL